jgi:UPF0755 protein
VPAWLGLLLAMGAALGVAWMMSGTDGDQGSRPRAAAEPPPVTVTFPEGLRREEMARILEAKTHISARAYLAATGPGERGRRLAGTDRPTSLEGFLFPATYQVGRRLTAGELVNAQVAAYRSYTAEVDYRYARSRKLTPYDVLIIASLIEREVRVPSERPLVASVIYNRLRRGMRLDIDATVQYALGEWKADLTARDLDVDDPYNTRRYPGLPPGPICNPGLASIAAAARPTQTPFLYYVARRDGSGRHYFARTLAEFERAVERARTAGGRG